MQLPSRFQFDALVLTSQNPSDDPHHLLERSHLGATAEVHCYPDDSELFQGKAKFTCDNEEKVILISPTHPLFDVSHHFVFHTQQGGQDTANNPIPNGNAENATENISDSSPHLTATRKMPMKIPEAPTTVPTTEEPSTTYFF